MRRAVTVEKADFIVGTYKGEAVVAQLEIAMDNKTIVLGVGTNNSIPNKMVLKNYNRYKYYFHIVCATEDTTAGYYVPLCLEQYCRWIRKGLGMPQSEPVKIAIMAEKATWVKKLVEEMQKPGTFSGKKDWVSKLNIKWVGTWEPSSKATDVTAELTQIAAKDPHLIATLFTGPVGAVVTKQRKELGVPAIQGLCNAMMAKGNYWKDTDGTCNYESSDLGSNFNVKTGPKQPHFWKEFNKKYGEEPMYTASSYEAMYLLKEAIEKAGTIQADAVVSALEKTRMSLVIGTWEFDKSHEPKHGPKYIPQGIAQWQDGKLVGVFPDGHGSVLFPGYEGFKPEGTETFRLPPEFIKHFKK
jgi:branched-chain amino acid transport system substrate-binding protein